MLKMLLCAGCCSWISHLAQNSALNWILWKLQWSKLKYYFMKSTMIWKSQIIQISSKSYCSLLSMGILWWFTLIPKLPRLLFVLIQLEKTTAFCLRSRFIGVVRKKSIFCHIAVFSSCRNLWRLSRIRFQVPSSKFDLVSKFTTGRLGWPHSTIILL